MDMVMAAQMLDATDDGELNGIGYIMGLVVRHRGNKIGKLTKVYNFSNDPNSPSKYVWNCTNTALCQIDRSLGELNYYCCGNCYKGVIHGKD